MSDATYFLDAMWELNKQQIEEILKYREGGGLERVVETTQRLNDLTERQMKLLDLMIKLDEQRCVSTVRRDG